MNPLQRDGIERAQPQTKLVCPVLQGRLRIRVTPSAE